MHSTTTCQRERTKQHLWTAPIISQIWNNFEIGRGWGKSRIIPKNGFQVLCSMKIVQFDFFVVVLNSRATGEGSQNLGILCKLNFSMWRKLKHLTFCELMAFNHIIRAPQTLLLTFEEKRRQGGDLGFSRKRETLRCSGSLMAAPRGSLAQIILNSQTQTCSTSHTFSSSSASSTLLLFLLLLSTSSSFPSLTMVSLCPTPSEHPSAGNMIKVIWSL